MVARAVKGRPQVLVLAIALAASALLVPAAAAPSSSAKTAGCNPITNEPMVSTERTCTLVARGLLNPPSQVLHRIAWGDGETTTVTLDPTDDRRIPHTYRAPGVYTIVQTPTYVNTGQTYEVRFTVEIVNQAPIARNDTWLAAQGKTLKVNVLANDRDPDGDPIKATNWQLKEPGESSYGALSKRFNVDSDGTLAFVPPNAKAGTSSLTYQASDGWSTTARTTGSQRRPTPRYASRLTTRQGDDSQFGLVLEPPQSGIRERDNQVRQEATEQTTKVVYVRSHFDEVQRHRVG